MRDEDYYNELSAKAERGELKVKPGTGLRGKAAQRAAQAALLAAGLLLTGCSATPPADAPVTGQAQGLGSQKVDLTNVSQSSFSQVYESTKGTVDFRSLDKMEWQVVRVTSPSGGQSSLPPGDNFKATAQSNFDYNQIVKDWVASLEQDGWKASNEVKASPASDEDTLKNTLQDYRLKAYSVDLAKGKSSVQVRITEGLPGTITLTINSQ